MQLKTLAGTKLEFLSFSQDKNLIWTKIVKLGINNHILIADLDEESKEKLLELKTKNV